MRFGFSPDRPLDVMDALLQHPSLETWTQAFEAPHRAKLYFDGPLISPDGRNQVVRTVWQVDHDGDVRTACFITIKPRVPASSSPGRHRPDPLGAGHSCSPARDRPAHIRQHARRSRPAGLAA
jgi:hypothetical protein